MSDCFNLGEIDKSIIDLIRTESDISNICREYINSPTKENTDKLIEILEEREKKALKVKKNIVIMIERTEESEETLDVNVTEKGLEIKE